MIGTIVNLDDVKQISEELGITRNLAKELLVLSGGNTNIVIEASHMSSGLDHCKARIIDARLNELLNSFS